MRRLVLAALAVALLAACASPPPAPTPTQPRAPSVTPPLPSPTPTREPLPIPTAAAPATATPSVPEATDLDVSGEVSLELVAQTGGLVQSVAVEGDVAYVGVGPRVVAFDTTALPELREIGQSELLPGSVRAVIVQAGTVYAGTDYHVVALDVSDPAAMVMQSQLELPGPASDLALGGGTLYAAGVAGVDSPEPDSELGELQFTSHITAVDAAGELAVLTTRTVPAQVDQLVWVNGTLYGSGRGRAGLWALEAQPGGELGKPVAVWATDDVNNLTAYGGVLLVGDYIGVSALDTHDPFQPELLWEADRAWHGVVTGIVTRGGLLYTVGFQPAGGYVPARVVEELPQPLPTEEPATASAVAVLAGEYLLAVEGTLNVYPLAAFDPADQSPESVPEPVAAYLPPVPRVHFATAGDDFLVALEYVRREGEELSIDLHTRSLPDLDVLGSLEELTSGHLPGMAVEGSQVYLWTESGDLLTVGLQDQSNPVLTSGPAPILLDGTQLAGGPILPPTIASDERVYANRIGTITLIDATDPEHPNVIAQDNTGNGQIAMSVGDTSVYANDLLHLYVLDAMTLELQSRLAVPGIRHIAADGDLVAAASILDGLVLISAAAPANPEVVGTLPFRGGHQVALSGNLAFVVTRPNTYYDFQNTRLVIVDISDPAAPRGVGLARSPALMSFNPHVIPWGQYVIVQDGVSIYVYRVVRE